MATGDSLWPLRFRIGLALAVGLGALAAPSRAQQFGQWWWQGLAAYEFRSYDNSSGGRTLSSTDERHLRLSMGLNGYLGHPTLGRFRLGIESLRDRYTGGGSIDSKSLGYWVGIDLLPRGRFPFSFDYRRGSYDYQAGAGYPAFALSRFPDLETTFAGRLRFNASFLRGLKLGTDLSRFQFVDPALREEKRLRSYADWNRLVGPFNNSLRVERDANDYALVGFSSDLWNATLDQTARFSNRWDWQIRLQGLRTTIDNTQAATPEAGAATASTDELRGFWQIRREVRVNDLLDLRIESDSVRPDYAETSTGYGAWLTYRWRPRPGTQISPFVSRAKLDTQASESTTTRAGLDLQWVRSGERLDTTLGGTMSSGSVRAAGGAPGPSSDDMAYSVLGAVAFGDATRLRTDLELEAGHNQLRLVGLGGTLPPGALPSGVFGAEDFTRGRLRLHRDGRRARLGASSEWRRRESTELVGGEPLTRDELLLTFDASFRTMNFGLNAGGSKARLAESATDELRYVSAIVGLRFSRYVNLKAVYRHDVRDTLQVADIEANRKSLELGFAMGYLTLRAEAYETTESVGVDDERRNRGLRWSIERGFAGWLPIVTGSRRRGEIR